MKNKTLIILFVATSLWLGCTKDKVPAPVVAPEPTEGKDTVSFQTKVLPLIEDNCFSCHAGGTQPLINDYATIVKESDKMIKSMRGDGVSLMPQGGPALPKEKIDEFECWMKQGKLNN